MRTIATIIVAIVLPFSFAACGPEVVTEKSSDETTTSSTPETEDSTPTVPEGAKDDVFLTAVHDTTPLAATVPDYLLIDIAQSTCDLFDVGGDMSDVFESVQSSGIDPELAGAIVGAGTAVYCPEHTGIVTGSSI